MIVGGANFRKFARLTMLIYYNLFFVDVNSNFQRFCIEITVFWCEMYLCYANVVKRDMMKANIFEGFDEGQIFRRNAYDKRTAAARNLSRNG